MPVLLPVVNPVLIFCLGFGNCSCTDIAEQAQFFQTVREKQLMSIQDAVYKATALPAQILGLYDRGQLKKGMAADITIFDRERIASRSTYLDSKVRPVGISYVFVGGKLAYCDGRTVDFHSGKVLLHL